MIVRRRNRSSGSRRSARALASTARLRLAPRNRQGVGGGGPSEPEGRSSAAGEVRLGEDTETLVGVAADVRPARGALGRKTLSEGRRTPKRPVVLGCVEEKREPGLRSKSRGAPPMRPKSSLRSVLPCQLGPQPTERQGIFAGPRGGGDPMRPIAADHFQRARERDVSVCWGKTRALPLEPTKR